MKFCKRKICQALSLVAAGLSTTTAMAAAPIIQGGGASLVTPLIDAEIAQFSTSLGSITYFSVGSSAGESAFLLNQPTFFGVTVTGTVDFANSDAALLASQISYYNALAGTTNGPLIQIPYLVTAITIPVVNAPFVTSTTTPQTAPNQAHSIALNDNDLCGIFSGKLTNWNQVVNPEIGTTYPANAPITVIYRVDGAGTTELLMRHLAQVCTTGAGGNSNVSFIDSTTFLDSFPSGPPSNFVSAYLEKGVRTQLTSAAGAAVAYLGPAYTNTYIAPTSSVVTSGGAAQLPLASLLNAHDGVYYAPAYANATRAVGPILPPGTRAQAANPLNWVPNTGNPTSGYPVSGTSQIIVSQCYQNPAVTQALEVFLNAHYSSAAFAALVHGNGFDTVPAAYLSAIQSMFLNNSLNFNLNLGNSTVCSGTVIGR
ncbi:substrate-binding domain-containing protein [Burkholderia perseverans]|uniref:substrate-binding domain-containing protein n=1 Tax=Burkholderia perseverans TaxID=2615214 RepID=UPI001FEEC6E6|nr:substrate-binding domain-containing protein [Burkholderia perseverans]